MYNMIDDVIVKMMQSIARSRIDRKLEDLSERYGRLTYLCVIYMLERRAIYNW